MTHYHNLVCPYAFLKLTSPPHKLSMNAERVIPNFYILGHTLTSRIWIHTWRLHFIHRYSAIFSVRFQHPVIIESNICLYCFLYLMGSILCLFAHSCLTLHDPMVCSLPGSSVHGDSPGKNTREGCHVLLQGIFPTQGLNPGLQHCRQILYHLSHQGNKTFYIIPLLPSSNKDSPIQKLTQSPQFNIPPTISQANTTWIRLLPKQIWHN